MNSQCSLVGVDIGGTKILVGAISTTGRVLATVQVPTPKAFENGLASIEDCVRQVLALTNVPLRRLSGIGIGCTGIVDSQSGVLLKSTNLPDWQGHSIAAALKTKFGVKALAENDAASAALGESIFGAGKGTSRCALIAIGTGIGGAVVHDGIVYRGSAGQLPEIGHIPLDRSGPSCQCGFSGCYESIVSGKAIEHLAKANGFEGPSTLFAAATSKNPAASAIVATIMAAHTSAVRTILYTFLPEIIILSGSVALKQFPSFRYATSSAIDAASFLPATRPIVRPALLGANAVMIGATALVGMRASATCDSTSCSNCATASLKTARIS